MLRDPIIEEVWKAKDEIAASCGYDPRKLAEMLKRSQLSKGVKTVDLHRRPVECVAEEPVEYKTKPAE
jgi:hypothetical protein